MTIGMALYMVLIRVFRDSPVVLAGGVSALQLFFVGWFVARLLRNILHKALTRLGVDALVDKSGLGAPIERAGYPDSGLLLARIVYWGLMLIVLQLTFDTLEITEVNDLLDDFVAFIPRHPRSLPIRLCG